MTYSCILCGKSFEATHFSKLCPVCRYPKCLNCGKEFRLAMPYNQVCCSRTCARQYQKKTGADILIREKAKATMLERYGVDNAAKLENVYKPRICAYCGKQFQPTQAQQKYCTDVHYGPCPICGEPTIIKDMKIGPQCCSEKCRQKRIANTCLEKYGNTCVLNSDYGLAKRQESCLERYGVTSYSKTEEFKSKHRATCIERYGVTSPLKNEDIKAKARATNIARYGGASPTCDSDVMRKAMNTLNTKYGGMGKGSPILKQKIETTCVERYGCNNPLSNKLVKYKIANTNLQRYGTSNLFQSPIIRERIKNTCIEKYGGNTPMSDINICNTVMSKLRNTLMLRYGVDNPTKLRLFRDKIKSTMQQRYGVDWYVLSDKCSRENSYTRISKVNSAFSDMLISNKIAHIMEFKLDGKFFDFKIGRFLVEVDPTITHNSYMSVFESSDPKPMNYQQLKTDVAKSSGYDCIHIFDWDDTYKIMSRFLPKERIYARNCHVQQIPKSIADDFLNEYHLFGACDSATNNLGLYYGSELVQVMSFSKQASDSIYDYELIRFCSKSTLFVIGGVSKLFHHFINENPFVTVISYCDLSKFSGKVYTQLGFVLDKILPPMKQWSYKDQRIPDTELKQLGYSALFDVDDNSSVSDEQYMLDNKWLPIYDCGQAVYVYKKLPPGTDLSAFGS